MTYTDAISFIRTKIMINVTLQHFAPLDDAPWFGARSLLPSGVDGDSLSPLPPHRRSSMASVLSRRLGKRSLLGARVLGPVASDGPLGAGLPLEPQAELPEGSTLQPVLTCKDSGRSLEQPQELLQALGPAGFQQVAFQPGQKVS